jgi:hypothetical protein
VCVERATHVSDESTKSSSVHSDNLQTINRFASVVVKPTIHTTDSAAYSADQIQTTSTEQTHAISTTQFRIATSTTQSLSNPAGLVEPVSA